MKASILLTLLVCSIYITNAISSDLDCSTYDTHKLVGSILCLVESKKWTFHPSSRITEGWGCLIGQGRCNTKMVLPQKGDVPPSPAPPPAKIKEYHRLAMKAEALVPKAWYRDGYAHERSVTDTQTISFFVRAVFTVLVFTDKTLKPSI